MSTTVTLERVVTGAAGGSPLIDRPVGTPTRTRTRRAPRRSSGPVGAPHRAPVRACSLEGVRSGVEESARPARDTLRPAAGPVALTRRGRVVTVAVLILVACGALSMGVSAATTGSPSDTAVVYQTRTVQPGESLWVIARAASPGADPRSTIARIVELNGLESSSGLRAGQQLTVPVDR